MSDNKESPLVEFASETATIHFGQNEYNSHWLGSRVSRNVLVLKSLSLPIGVLALLFAWFSKSSAPVGDSGKELQSPNIVGDLPIVDTRVLNERDLINRIRQPPIKISVLGRIKVLNLRAQTEIPVGTEAKAILESGATNGIVKARLLSPIMVDGEPVIPENSTVFGRGKSGEERLYVEFSRAVLKSGESIPIRAQAFESSDKILGLKGSFIGAKTMKMAKAMGFGFVGGMAEGLQQDTSGSLFAAGRKPSIRDGALAGTSKAMLDQSQAYIEEMKNTPNVIEVKQGSEFYLIFDEARKTEEQK